MSPQKVIQHGQDSLLLTFHATSLGTPESAQALTPSLPPNPPLLEEAGKSSRQHRGHFQIERVLPTAPETWETRLYPGDTPMCFAAAPSTTRVQQWTRLAVQSRTSSCDGKPHLYQQQLRSCLSGRPVRTGQRLLGASTNSVTKARVLRTFVFGKSLRPHDSPPRCARGDNGPARELSRGRASRPGDKTDTDARRIYHLPPQEHGSRDTGDIRDETPPPEVRPPLPLVPTNYGQAQLVGHRGDRRRTESVECGRRRSSAIGGTRI